MQARYATVQHKWTKAPEERRFNQFRRPKYLFSGLTSNKLTTRRQDVEARVLNALQDKLMRKELFEEFAKRCCSPPKRSANAPCRSPVGSEVECVITNSD